MVLMIGSKKHHCPLCDEEFSSRKALIKGKVHRIFFCRPCKIGLPEIDPAFGKWRDTDKIVPCDACGTPMKWFLRYVDGYFKATCPGCGITVEKDSNATMDKNNEISLEDFKGADETKSEMLYLPIDKLNMSSDRKKELKAKIARKNNERKEK